MNFSSAIFPQTFPSSSKKKMSVYKNLENKNYKTSEPDLKSLLKEFLRKSEVLEEKENHVMKQVELLHAAVTSLQQESSRRQTTESLMPAVNSNLLRIEEETKKIEEETKRIQEEINEKIESNRILEEQIRERKFEFRNTREIQEEVDFSKATKKADLGVVFFNKKLNNLKAMEKRLRKESIEGQEEARVRLKHLKDKLAALEWDSELDKMVLESLEKLSHMKTKP